MPHLAPIRARKPSEDGLMLLAVIFMLLLLVFALSVAAPRIAKSIQLDREHETMERGKQYIRAIQLYYRKFGAYPPNMDALVKSNDIRFLRKKYADPLTGKPDWKPIMFGQNKAPLAMGFFGQPLGGMGGATPVAGIGPSGGNTAAGSGLGGSTGSGFSGGGFGGNTMGGGMNSPFGGGMSSPVGGGMGSSPGGSLFSSPSSGATAAGGAATAGGNSAGGSDGSGTGGTNGSSTPGTGSAMGGLNGQTFGGAGIIGVEPVLNKPSIMIYKKKSRYNQWEFTYSPLLDMMKQMGGRGGVGGQMPGSMTGQPGAPGFGSTTSPGGGMGTPGGGMGSGGIGGGSSFGGSSFGGSSFGSGQSPSPAQPAQPQQ